MGFSRQEYWSGLPFPSPGDLPDPGIEPRSPALQADALTSEPPGSPKKYGMLHKFVCHPISAWENAKGSNCSWGGRRNILQFASRFRRREGESWLS